MGTRRKYHVTMEVQIEAEDTEMGTAEAIAIVSAQNIADTIAEMFDCPCIVGDMDLGELVLPTFKRRTIK